MGAEDVKRQAPNVGRMKLLGARVVPVESGSRTLKDAMNEALRDWVTNVRTTHYCIGSAAGPHPYPEPVAMLRLNRVVGKPFRHTWQSGGQGDPLYITKSVVIYTADRGEGFKYKVDVLQPDPENGGLYGIESA